MEPLAPLSRHLPGLVAELAGRAPKRPALIDEAGEVSYGELDRLIGSAAGRLRAAGVRAGATTGLLCTNRREWVAAAFGAMRLGSRVAAFNTWAKPWDLGYMLAHSRAEVLICIDAFRGRSYVEMVAEMIPELSSPAGEWASEEFPELRRVLFIGDAELPAGGEPMDAPAPRAGVVAPAGLEGDDAFVLYTSGSSARPKAVPMRHGEAIVNAGAIGDRMGLTAEDRVLLTAPLFWSYGAINALPATFTRGAALVVHQGFDAGQTLAAIESERCTAIYTLPNITSALAAHPEFRPGRVATLRTGLTIGGREQVRYAAEQLQLPQLCNIYGSTETYGNCCVTPAEVPFERRVDSQGPPLPGVELSIVDPQTGAGCAAGIVGEILVRGRIAQGYLGADGVSVEPITDEWGWYHSGDLGSLDEAGWLHFAARATEMIKTGGINVSPSEVEELLGLHPDVADAAVVAAPDADLGEIVVACVVPAAGREVQAQELIGWCRTRVAAFKVPREIHVLAALPRTDTDKLSRRALRERFSASAAEAEQAPRADR